MPILASEFGYYPHALAVQWGSISIEVLPEIEDTVRAIESSERVDGDWIYAPAKFVQRFPGREVEGRPYPSCIFGLSKTHRITQLAADSDDHLAFILWALSLFIGMRLTATEAGFIDSTPIQPGRLVDFVLLGHNLESTLALAEAFWVAHRSTPQQPRRLAAAIHALFLAQHPQHLQFEEVMLLLAAIDACFAIAAALYSPPPRLGHARRIAWMCGLFAMPVPDWASPDATGGAEAAIIRNNAVHEALFMGQPFGFAVHGVGSSQNLALEMKALICRLLVAVLGASDCDYVRSPVNTRQRYGLRLP